MSIANLMRDLDEELKGKYDKVLEEKADDIKRLMEWVKKQPHLPKLNDIHLYIFLRLTDSSLEQCKELVEKYFGLKTRHDHFFQSRLEHAKLDQTLDLVQACLPDDSMQGYRLFFVKLAHTDASKVDFLRDMRVFTAAFDYELYRNPFHKGLISVIDASGLHIGYIPKINLSIVSVVFKFLQLYEGAMHQTHIINCVPVVSQVLALIRPFLSPKIANMLKFHSTSEMEAFHEKYVEKKYMPSNYGGNLPSMATLHNEFKKRIHEAKDWIDELDSKDYQIADSKKLKATKKEMIGSFRQLNID